MRFRGQLLIPTEEGPGLEVDLEVADRRLAVVSDSETLGTWPLDSVRVRRLAGDKFQMTVAGEDLHFVANDTISFAYDGIQAIERHGGDLRGLVPLKGLKTLFRLGGGRRDEAAPDATTPETTTDAPLELAQTDRHALDTPEESVFNAAPELSPTPPPEPAPAGIDEVDDPMSVPEWLDRPTMPEPVVDLSPLEVEPDPVTEPSTGRCRALRNDGHPCESPIVGDSGYCFPHDPSNPVGKGFHDAQKARSRLKQKRAERLSRVYSRLDKALKQVEKGELETSQAMAMAQLARTMCAILELDDEPEDEDPRSFFFS